MYNSHSMTNTCEEVFRRYQYPTKLEEVYSCLGLLLKNIFKGCECCSKILL